MKLESIDRFNWYGFDHDAVNKRFEGDLTYVGTFCVNDEYNPSAVYYNANPNRTKKHKDFLLLTKQDNLFEDVGGKPVTIVRGMDKDEMEKWRYQQGVLCGDCGDIIYSIMRHDYRHCNCGGCNVDGGRDYLKIGFKEEAPHSIVTIDFFTGYVE